MKLIGLIFGGNTSYPKGEKVMKDNRLECSRCGRRFTYETDYYNHNHTQEMR